VPAIIFAETIAGKGFQTIHARYMQKKMIVYQKYQERKYTICNRLNSLKSRYSTSKKVIFIGKS